MNNSTTEIITFRCEHCGEIYAKLDANYITHNPNASDMYIEQLRLEHEVYCAEIPEIEVVCDSCGDFICSYPAASEYLNPNGLGRWIMGEREWHNKFCAGTEEEQEETTWVNKQFGERKLSKEDFKHFYSLHRDSENNKHYPCFHYMQNLASQDTHTAPEKIARIKRIRKGRVRR